jgi:hypothetical protein
MTKVKVLNGIDSLGMPVSDQFISVCKRRVRSVAFSHRGNIIAGCSGSVVKVLEAATGVCLATLDGHDEMYFRRVFA